MEADCAAIDELVKYGFEDHHFEDLFADMVNYDLLKKALEGVRFTEYIAMAHQWTPEERLEHNKQCLMNSRLKYSAPKHAPAVGMTASR